MYFKKNNSTFQRVLFEPMSFKSVSQLRVISFYLVILACSVSNSFSADDLLFPYSLMEQDL